MLWIPGSWMPSLPHVVLMRCHCLLLELHLSSRERNSCLLLLKGKSIWGWFTMKTICRKALLVLDHWNLWWILGVEWNMGGSGICLSLPVLGPKLWPYGWERTSVFFLRGTVILITVLLHFSLPVQRYKKTTHYQGIYQPMLLLSNWLIYILPYLFQGIFFFL